MATTLTAANQASSWIRWNSEFYMPSNVTGGGLIYPQTAATAITNTAVWNSWVQVQDAGLAAIATAPAPHPAYTPEEQARMAAMAAHADRAYRLNSAKRELNRLRSVRRARRLLEEILSPEQREQLKAQGFFLVRQGNHIYRINRGKTHNVYLVDANGHAIENLCIIPDDYERVPEEDCMIAQKLLLEADHASFRIIANIGRFPPGTIPARGVSQPSARDWLRTRPARARRAA